MKRLIKLPAVIAATIAVTAVFAQPAANVQHNFSIDQYRSTEISRMPDDGHTSEVWLPDLLLQVPLAQTHAGEFLIAT